MQPRYTPQGGLARAEIGSRSDQFPRSTYSIVACCNLLTIIPLIGVFIPLATIVLWTIYWIKVAGFSAQLGAPANTLQTTL
jgi:hypothetical protein